MTCGTEAAHERGIACKWTISEHDNDVRPRGSNTRPAGLCGLIIITECGPAE